MFTPCCFTVTAPSQVSGEAAYTYDAKQERDGFYGALAITTQSAGTITAIDTTAALGTFAT